MLAKTLWAWRGEKEQAPGEKDTNMMSGESEGDPASRAL